MVRKHFEVSDIMKHALFHLTSVVCTIRLFSSISRGYAPLPGNASRSALSENNFLDCATYNFASSFTVPIFSLDEYFFNTLSLWYFQNCLVAFFPATLFRILLPPGCSSTNLHTLSARILECEQEGPCLPGHIVYVLVDDDVYTLVR